MEGLTRLVAESFARHGFDRPLDYRRLRWSRWFRCESLHSLLFVPSKPGIFALSEEVMTFGGASSTATACVGTGASPVQPERSSAAVGVTTTFESSTAREGHDFSRAVSPAQNGAASAAEARRMLAVLQFTEADDMAYTLDRLLSRENPMRARLLSGRIFIRYVTIEDDAQRRSTAAALNQWLQSSSEAATGIGAHFATSLELTPNDSPNIHSPTSLPSGF